MKNSQSDIILLTFPGSESSVGAWLRCLDEACQVGAGLEDRWHAPYLLWPGCLSTESPHPTPCVKVIMGTLENHTRFFFFVLPGRSECETCHCAWNIFCFLKNNAWRQPESLGNWVSHFPKRKEWPPSRPLDRDDHPQFALNWYTCKIDAAAANGALEHLLCGSPLHAISSPQPIPLEVILQMKILRFRWWVTGLRPLGSQVAKLRFKLSLVGPSSPSSYPLHAMAAPN